MKRRRRSRVSPSLFPFLSVLLCAMGVLIVVISGQNLLAVGGGIDQALEIGSGTFEGKEAIYIECREEGIIIYPEETAVPLQEIKDEDPGSAWMQLLTTLESRKEEQYLVFLIRPEGTEAFDYCEYQANLVRGIDAGKDALLSGGDLILMEDGKPILSEE
jgi:hypothetical protein